MNYRQTPTRDERYMGLALFLASFSKDPNTQMGAVIVSPSNEVVGMGYNGPPRILNDDEINWSREEDADGLDKYDVMVHAEDNAFRFKRGDVSGATLYVTGLPCRNCALDIIKNEIHRVIFLPFKSNDPNSSFNKPPFKTPSLLKKAKIELIEFDGKLGWAHEWMRNKCNDRDIQSYFKPTKIVCVSGYLAPIHCGHIDYFNAAKKLGDYLIVIVNNDKQLQMKKGYIPIDEKTRLTIIDSLKMVDRAVLSIDNDSSVCETLKIIKPHIFANGGDVKDCREKEVCKELGIELVYGVGGEKIDSSSAILERIKNEK